MGNRWNLGKRNAGYGAEIPNGETYKYGDSSSEIEIGGVGKDCAFFRIPYEGTHGRESLIGGICLHSVK